MRGAMLCLDCGSPMVCKSCHPAPSDVQEGEAKEARIVARSGTARQLLARLIPALAENARLRERVEELELSRSAILKAGVEQEERAIKAEARAEELQRLVLGVKVSEREVWCDDVDGKNWFDRRDELLRALAGSET